VAAILHFSAPLVRIGQDLPAGDLDEWIVNLTAIGVSRQP
jgi:hypothetical protein